MSHIFVSQHYLVVEAADDEDIFVGARGIERLARA
jgi:hypothetical protein